jgi:hypothetical protein
MMIIGCDFHTRYQQIAMVDEATGELVERQLRTPRNRPRHRRAFGASSVELSPRAARDSGPLPLVV